MNDEICRKLKQLQPAPTLQLSVAATVLQCEDDIIKICGDRKQAREKVTKKEAARKNKIATGPEFAQFENL